MGIEKISLHLLQDQLFPESRTGSAYYIDHGHSSTEIKFLDGQKAKPPTMHFKSRDDMLYHVAKEQVKENKNLWENGKITTADRYRGFEDGLKAKVKGVWSRTMHIIKVAWTNVRKKGSLKGSVSQGLINYDRKLLGRVKTKAWVNFSLKQVRDFVVKPNIQSLVSEELSKTYSIARWHHNGPSGYSFTNESEETEVLQNTVTASNDRFAKSISMMRRIDDYTTGESITYTGRGDTESKAMEQLSFIFQNELAKNPAAQKGLKKTENGYELTFMLNNLMSSNLFLGIGTSGLVGLDERDSMLREKEIFGALSRGPITLTDKIGTQHTVTIKPLYFNQGFNSLAPLLGTPWKQTKINNEAYALLFPLIDDAILNNSSISAHDNQLLQSAKNRLSNPSKLKPEEEFFYRNLAMKILKIPVIDHCKSSIDRTSLASSISAALQSWRNLEKDIPLENPHDILTKPLFKELFMVNIHGAHQATQASRSSEGMIEGQQQLTHAHGFEWGGNDFGHQNPIPLRMVPDRYASKTRTKFNLDSPLMRGRNLLKAKGMKMFYTNDHPLIMEQEEQKRKIEQERQRRIQSLYLRAAAA